MRTSRLFLAAAVAVGGFSFVSTVRADDADSTKGIGERAGEKVDRAVDRTGDAMERAGDRMSGATTNPAMAQAPDAQHIRETIREVTQAALTKGGIDDIVERFERSDRKRLDNSNAVEKSDATLDGRIAQFQKDWKDKYNQDFEIHDRAAVYNDAFASIMENENGEARLAGERQNAAPQGDQAANRENYRKTATVAVSASHGLPQINVPLVRVFLNRWKIDVPDTLTAQQFHDNLLNQLTYLDEHKDQWPADPNEAYRLVTHHVLMAVMGMEGTGSQPGMQNR